VEITPNDLVLVSRREEPILVATKVELVIYNRWKINPEYEKVLSLTYPSKTRNKEHQGSCKAYKVG
jgi:hypothetical protein